MITERPDSLSVIQGQSVSFRCLFNYKEPVKSILNEVKITWYKNGIKLDSSLFKTESIVGENGSELSFHDVQLADAGYYQCLVQNEVSSTMAKALLTVKESKLNQSRDIFDRGERPQNLKAITGTYGQVHLSWTFHKKPTTSHYVVSYSLSNRSDATPTTKKTTTNSLTIENLEPGNYHFSVAKIDGKNMTDELFGWSKAKTFTVYDNAKLPETVENFEITKIEYDSIRVNWADQSIYDYDLVATESLSGTTRKPKRKTKGSAVINNLSCNTNYTVSLSARNKYGQGSSLVRPFQTKKSKPLVQFRDINTKYLTKLSTEISWKFEKPKNWCGDNNTIVVAYRQVTNSRQNKWVEQRVGYKENSSVIDNLRSNRKYEIKVYAENEMGRGLEIKTRFQHSAKFDRINNEMKGPVELNLLYTQAISHDTIQIMWQVEPDLRPIEGFKIIWGSEDPFEHEELVGEGERIYDIHGLKPDTKYLVSVQIVYSLSSDGQPVKSQSKAKFKETRTKPFNDKPATPVAVKAKVLSARKIRVSWSDQRKDPLKFPIKGRKKESFEYEIRIKNIGSRKGEKKFSYFNCTKTGNQERVYDVDNLRPFTTYDISVRQVVADKESDWSIIEQARTLEAKPETSPEDFTAKPTGDSIQLSWQPPLAANGKVTGYLIKYRQKADYVTEGESDWQLKTVLGDALTCPIRNAEPETEYHFVISAKNSKGTGPESTQLVFITPSVANKACFQSKFIFLREIIFI